MRTIRLLLASWLVLSLHCNYAVGAPQTGWWWNPTESGRGFFIESDNGITFIGAYLYDADGRATWLAAGGPNNDPYNFTGQLYSMKQGQTLLGAYVAPVGPEYAGSMTVHFSDDTHGTVTWPGGTLAIERFKFGAAETPFQPAPGWWWNADENGSGYSIEIQGDTLFFVGFMYDGDGKPVWYYSAGTMKSLTTYSGSLLQFAGGQTLGGPYRPPQTPTVVGRVDIDFYGWDLATLKFSGLGVVSAQSTVKRVRPNAESPSRSVTAKPTFRKARRPFVEPPTDGRPNVYISKSVVQQLTVLTGYSAKFTYSADWYWKRYDCGIGTVACYFVYVGTLVVNFELNALIGEGGRCHGQGVRTLNSFAPSATLLQIRTDGTWDLRLDLGGLGDEVDVTTTCTINGMDATQTLPNGWGWHHETRQCCIPNKVPSPSTYANGQFVVFEDQDGGFWESYGIGTGDNIHEDGWLLFFPG